ncbi:MAG: hypothetical protein AAF614_37905 [Chloroflexota bacterium]
MAKLKLKGRVVYPPGPWGANKPVANAKITIQDIDLPGQKNDTIFTATADANGRFSGTSAEWQDTKKVRYWHINPGFPPTGRWATKTILDPTDIMTLTIKIEADGTEITGPYPFLGDNVEVLLPVPWIPPQPPAWGRLNGTSFDDTQTLLDSLMTRIEAKGTVELELFGGWAEEAQALVELINTSPLELAQNVFPGSQSGSITLALASGLTLTISASALMSMGALVLALGAFVLLTGAAVFVSALGIAVILAIVNGYCDISAGQHTSTDQNGNPTNGVKIMLSNSGC